MPKDTWLLGRDRERLTKAAIKAGRSKKPLEASSDLTYRLLMREQAPRIVNWGGVDKDQHVTVVKSVPTWPDSRQLRDPFTTYYVQGIALEPPLPPDRMLNLTEENPLHAGCLMAKATDACGRGWQFEPRRSKAAQDVPKEDEGDKYTKILDGLCPEQTFTELLYMAAWEMDAIGWSAWEIVRDLDKRKKSDSDYPEIGAIYPIPAHTLRATLDPRKWVQIRAGRVRYFKKFGADCTINNETGTVYEWSSADELAQAKKLDSMYIASEIIIFKSYTPRSLWYGVPKWVSAIATIAEMTAIREFNVSWFGSGGQTDYSVHFKANDIAVAQKMRAEAQEQLREYAGRGHTLLLTAGTEDTEVAVEKLGELLREGHFRFRREALAREVLIAHNVPPYRVGWAETGTLAGAPAREMLNAYKFGAVDPIQEVIESRLRTTLFDKDMGIATGNYELKLRDLDLDDLESELNLVNSGVDKGYITPNQARERLELEVDEEHPELNEYYVRGQKLGDSSGGGFDNYSDWSQEGDEEEMRAVRRVYRPGDVIRAVERLERTLRKATEEDIIDPIDGDRPARKPRRRGRPETVSPAGPARDSQPNIV